MIKRPLCLAAVFLLGVRLVLTGVFQRAEDLNPSLLEQTVADGDKITVTGTVYQREERPDDRIYYLTDVQICRDEQFINESNILVFFKQNKNQRSNSSYSEEISIGNRARMSGNISFFEPASNPGNFDRKFYYQKQGIHAAVWCEDAEVLDPAVWRVREGLTRFKLKWKSLLEDALGKYYGGCMSAILLGDKSELEEEVKELYQKSGIGHILAISGLHMSFLGIGFYQLLRKAGLPFLPAGAVGCLILVLYTWMIGKGVSGQRALIMFIVRVGADAAGRDYDLPTSLALAAAVITLRQPLYLYDAGFLLSFGALTGIAVVNPVLEKRSILPKALRASVSIYLVLLPILLYYYFEIPAYSLFLNLLVIPLMPAVLGTGIFGSLLTVFWNRGGSLILQICKMILWGYEQAAEITVKLPFGRLVLGQPEKGWCAVYYLVLFAVCVVIRKEVRHQEIKGKLWRSGLMLAYGVIFCIGCVWSHGKTGELRVTAIDVGQGDSLYIRTPAGRHFLIDGGSTSESQVGKYRIEPFLKSQGAGVLDYVFVSHGDADHINGISELLGAQEMGIRIRTLVLPDKKVWNDNLQKLAQLAADGGTRIVSMECGQQISDGDMTLKCLAPRQNYTGEIGNESSMVMELDYRKFEMLFTGDLEGAGEQQLLNSGVLRDYDVLKSGHHGSKNATSEEMLKIILPEITIISAGRGNRYGHPHEETIARLEGVKSRIFCTGEDGAVTITTDGEKVRIDRYLNKTK